MPVPYIVRLVASLAFSILVSALPLFAQSFDWVKSTSMKYDLNPQMPQSTLSSDNTGRVIAAHMDSVAIIVGDVYGKYTLDCRMPNGNLVWSYTLQSRAYVKSIAADSKGNILVSGRFLTLLKLGGTDSLQNTDGSDLNSNDFLLCLNAQGQLMWKRNMTSSPLSPNITTLACDATDHFWYASCDFMDSRLVQLDEKGADILTLKQGNVKILSSFCFDSQNNIYLCGATGSGAPFTMASLSRTVSESYAMFIARYTSAHEASWVHFAHDVTFNAPQVAVDSQGSIFFAGTLFDSAQVGNLVLHRPAFNQDIFVLKLNSDGNGIWAVQTPGSSPPKGTIERASQSFMSLLPNGGVVLSGTTRGELNWGNGVISNTGSISTYHCGFIAFSSEGKALWAVDGGASYTSTLHSISSTPSGDIYFSGAIKGDGVFGSHSVPAKDFTFVVGKLALPVTTSTELPLSDSPSLYPNPSADGLVNIPDALRSSSLLMYNSIGTCVFSNAAVEESRLNLSSLPTGMYVMEFRKGNLLHCIKWLRY